jgi:hypothetical protein
MVMTTQSPLYTGEGPEPSGKTISCRPTSYRTSIAVFGFTGVAVAVAGVGAAGAYAYPNREPFTAVTKFMTCNGVSNRSAEMKGWSLQEGHGDSCQLDIHEVVGKGRPYNRN